MADDISSTLSPNLSPASGREETGGTASQSLFPSPACGRGARGEGR
jgi:hypothetical protein